MEAGLSMCHRRMFYLYPEEFPELYRKRDTEKRESAERAIREVMTILAREP